MSRPQHKISVNNGKYTFVNRNGLVIDLLHHGDLMVTEYGALEAIAEMMRELDAARVVVKAVRDLAESPGDAPFQLVDTYRLIRALNHHDALTSDRTPPGEWVNNAARKEHP